MLLLLNERPVIIRMTFEEKCYYKILAEGKITILELSSFIYDFSLLHDYIALSALTDYKDYSFSQYFWYRKGRPLKQEHQLYLNRINHNSPLGFEIIIPAVAAAAGIPWLMIQAVEKISNWKLNREKLKLEVEKLKRENEKNKLEKAKKETELDILLRQRESIEIFYRIVQRLEESQLSAIDLEIIIPTDAINNDINKNQ